MKAVAIAATILAATIAHADDSRRPDPGYFTGVYERVGKDAALPAALIDDLVRIEPAPDGWGLLVFPCGVEMQGDGWPLELRGTDVDEVPNILAAKDGPFGLWCQYFNDHSNYPVLPCQSDMGARFTLWPITDARMTACMTAARQVYPGAE